MKKPPAEVVASLLAVTTLFVSTQLPPWAILIALAGTYAMGGPTPANLKRIWPVLPVGSLAGFLVVLGFGQAAHYFAGGSLVAAQMLILFCLNAGMMYLARLPGLGFIPGMFFGFATFFAVMFGGFGPAPKEPAAALLAAILMNAIGPAFAWITETCSAPQGGPEKVSGAGHMESPGPNEGKVSRAH